MTSDELANEIECAIENTDIPDNGIEICAARTEELQAYGLYFTLHDKFLTVSCDGDSETFFVVEENALRDAALFGKACLEELGIHAIV